MTERNINFKEFLNKGFIQIDSTFFALDRNLESLNSEQFEYCGIGYLNPNTEITNKEFNVKTIEKEVIEKEMRYECGSCDFRSYDKLSISVHQMIDHRDAT